MPDNSTSKIETARKSGRALTGADFKGAEPKKALSNLLKEDRGYKGAHATTSGPGFLGERKRATDALSTPKGFKKGGMVKKTGMALVHKGEKVLTKRQQKYGGKKVSK